MRAYAYVDRISLARFAPVSDGAGEVVHTGTKVTRFKVGDFVCPVYLPNWVDGPVNPYVLKRRLGGPDDGVLGAFLRTRGCRRPCSIASQTAGSGYTARNRGNGLALPLPVRIPPAR
jgi:hypothetical protein